MKRIALLLAAVGLGSGCVVETTTCDPQTLSIDWRFIDADGTRNLPCNGVPGGIDTVRVWIDGYEDAYSPFYCSDDGVVIPDVGTGTHRVVVEGYDGDTFVNRDWADVYVDSCGDTAFAANPGEGYLEFAPTGCSVNDGYLLYSLRDVTRGGAGYVFDRIDSTDGAAITTYTCSSGIYYVRTVPYGDYRLEGIEEVNAAATLGYSSHCATVGALVDFDSPTFFLPDTTVIPVAMSTAGGPCGL